MVYGSNDDDSDNDEDEDSRTNLLTKFYVNLCNHTSLSGGN